MQACTLILNKNGWEDTLECLESIFRSDPIALPVIVCDNDSGNGSLERIKAWAEGNLDAYITIDNPLRSLSSPPVSKPIPYVEYDRESAERGGDPREGPPLILIQNGDNLGFAGGNNVGLRYVIARGGFDYVWLLNPDTVIRADALERLIEVMRADPTIGICGSTLLNYGDPDHVQVMGGAEYNRWLALPRHIGSGAPASCPIDQNAVASRMDFVYGASMLVSSKFLAEVGLLEEDYFLYFEELDWALRAKGRFRLGYASGSIVYHREGSSLGKGAAKSPIADHHFILNRLKVTRRFNPAAVPTVYLALLIALLRRARRGQWDRVKMVAGVMLSR
ncbi:MAG TPA: glycosyltransferase family 2 protein [Longimicrobiaceae bacterium]|nr:glycosyltransferase family 2 protein [Longimicrobiaceae bacterium]